MYLYIVCVCPHDTAHMWRSEDHLWGLVLYFHHVDPRGWTQVFDSATGTYPLSHLACPPTPHTTLKSRSYLMSSALLRGGSAEGSRKHPCYLSLAFWPGRLSSTSLGGLGASRLDWSAQKCFCVEREPDVCSRRRDESSRWIRAESESPPARSVGSHPEVRVISAVLLLPSHRFGDGDICP